ncbi:MAG: ATP-binding protein [Lachnospiraceae bacterium]
MNIKQAKEEIRHTVQAYLMKNADGTYRIPAIRQRPLLLIGPPGIGKTQIMEQVARECRIGLVSYTITHHTRQSAVGLPFIREENFDKETYSVTEYTMSEIIASVYQKMRKTGLREGILFIDEINCVSETLAPTMLQFLQEKKFGNQKIPEGWIIVAAGNPPEYNKSVREFDMVTLDRVRCMPIEADLSVWKPYARRQHVNPAILSYLEIRPQNFYRVESTIDGLSFVTARGWEDLSNLMEVYRELEIPVTKEVIYEFLRHEDVAEDVAAYLDLYQKYQDDYGISEILAGRQKPEVFARIYQAAFDERLTVVNLLLDALFVQFEQAQQERKKTDDWYEFLKKYLAIIQQKAFPVEGYLALLLEEQEAVKQAEKQGIYNSKELASKKELLESLQECVPEIGRTPQNAFEQAKVGFGRQQEKAEFFENRALFALEAAFDFCEKAFEEGEEMVVFVTELTMNEVAARFLAEHPCVRYLKYSQKLLVGSRRAEILSELQR